MLIAKLQAKIATRFFLKEAIRGISFQGKKQYLSGYDDKLISDNELR